MSNKHVLALLFGGSDEGITSNKIWTVQTSSFHEENDKGHFFFTDPLCTNLTLTMYDGMYEVGTNIYVVGENVDESILNRRQIHFTGWCQNTCLPDL